ncbi:hypothetical protein ACFU53_36320 [Streptomyces sp. NPDC057474]|uniref:hypothetical protein n=1 Tax=Streptomyces sp. NPDC057474 TaxID=3346144 RepID=UPI0036BCB535
MMKNMKRLLQLITPICIIGLVTSCSLSSSDTKNEREIVSTTIVDADSHGFLTYNFQNGELKGHFKNGKASWAEKVTNLGEIHCARACPDAAYSTNSQEDSGPIGSSFVWRMQGEVVRKSFKDPEVNLYWSSGPADWVAADSHSLLWSSRGKDSSLPVKAGTNAPQGSLSSNGRLLSVSTARGDLTNSPWSGFLFDLSDGHPEKPHTISTGLPGPLGCLSTRPKYGITLGNDSQQVSLTNGKKLRSHRDFASECFTDGSHVISGKYTASENGNTQQILLQNITDSHSEAATTVATGDARISMYGDCGVLVSDGTVRLLDSSSTTLDTKVRAQDAVTVTDGTVYVVSADGKSAQYTLSSQGGKCTLVPEDDR